MNKQILEQLNQLRSTLAKMEEIFNGINESIVWVNMDGRIQWCNATFDRLLQKPHIQILGESIFAVINFEQSFALNNTKSSWQFSDILYQQGGDNRCLELSFKYFVDYQNEKSIIIIINDVTEKRKTQQQLEHLAHYDILTNIPNRMQFQSFLKRELSKSERHGRQFALMFIDLDKFKLVNDTYGHEYGDCLLKMVADRLSESMRIEDFIARMGGDEFILVVDENPDKEMVYKIADRIVKALIFPYEIAGRQILIGASIGIAFYPDDGITEPALLSVADARMYEAKRLGGNRYK